MIRPLSAPWLLRFDPDLLEVRLLVSGGPGCDLSLTWRGEGTCVQSSISPRELCSTRLGNHVTLARFAVEGYSGSGGEYQIRAGASSTPWLAVPPDPAPGESWRFLILSDHHGYSGCLLTMRAVARAASRQPFHGILFAGDMGSLPDDPASWFGSPDGLSFLDSMAAPVGEVFRDCGAGGVDAQSEGAERICRIGWPLLSTAPIFACPGNHEVSSERGADARERAVRVSPDSWNIETFRALFLRARAAGVPDAAPAAALGCYAASIGPLRILTLFVARRWVPGDHSTRTGPCYELPGRFIFEPITPGSPQLEWVQSWIVGSEGNPPAVAGSAESPALHVAVFHHPPFAQGGNAVPLFDEPVSYRTNLIARHLVPIIEPWAHLVLSGHNHAVNHHLIRGVHYFESSHMGTGKAPRARLPDGTPAPEPLGHPALFFAGEEPTTFYSVLDAAVHTQGVRARLSVYRVHPGGWAEEEYGFMLNTPKGARGVEFDSP